MFPAIVMLVVGANLCVPMISNICSIMSWNVRGINAPAKRSAICEVATMLKAAILTLQETKVELWTTGMAKEIGGEMLQGNAMLPALGTRGGLPFSRTSC